MGSSSNVILPSKSQVENQHKLKNNNNTNSETVGKPEFSQNTINNNIQDMAPPPIQQNKHPIDESLNDSTTSSKRNIKNNNPTIINKPNHLPTNQTRPLPQSQPWPQFRQQNPNNINNNVQPQMQIGVARSYTQPVAVPMGIPVQNYPYQGPYYPSGQPIYPYPYYGPQPSINPVVVMPPGYKPDYGYSPWGNIAEDLNNLF